ncbi:hypothetical protein CSOJ01_11356 [Colletotrichum sojae]|uniref:Uncharacterized protein n=1 Tax=Colletotrichum sojae TaxID=2175907 RepID=A0A8H6MNY5_9PEZI|nr:hypothetical protein CSOJ01_11356 [Colletotrichum sojae]
MENDCFDEVGRMIQIQTGRAFFQGSFRNLIVGYRRQPNERNTYYREILEPGQLAGSSRLEPHYRPPKTKVELNFGLKEEHIVLHAWLKYGASQDHAVRIDIAECIDIFRTQWMVPCCQHDVGSPYKVKNARELAVEGFHPARLVAKAVDYHALVFALKGNKLEQMLACGLMKIENAIGKTDHERQR